MSLPSPALAGGFSTTTPPGKPALLAGAYVLMRVSNFCRYMVSFNFLNPLFHSPFCLSTAAPSLVISIHMKYLCHPSFSFLSSGRRFLLGFLSRDWPDVLQGKPRLPPASSSHDQPPPAPFRKRPLLGLFLAAPQFPGQ